MSDEIVWEDPPPAQPGSQRMWRDRLEPLLARPNEWARVHLYGTSAVAEIIAGVLRQGKLTVPKGKWEFASRELEDGTGAVYAKYLGP